MRHSPPPLSLFLRLIGPPCPQQHDTYSRTQRDRQQTTAADYTDRWTTADQQTMSTAAWRSLLSPPDYENIEGRAALLKFVTVTSDAIGHAKMQMKCCFCGKCFPGNSQKIAAHFAGERNCHVAKCLKASPEAKVCSQTFLTDLEDKSASTRKREANTALVTTRQTKMRCKNDGEGMEAANKVFASLHSPQANLSVSVRVCTSENFGMRRRTALLGDRGWGRRSPQPTWSLYGGEIGV